MSQEVIIQGDIAYLSSSKALVTISNSSPITNDSASYISATPKNKPNTKEIEFVSWGKNNELPNEIMKSIYKNVTVSANIDFNAKVAYGSRIKVMRKTDDYKPDGTLKVKEVPYKEAEDIYEFLENNNINRIFQEFGNDLAVFSDAFIEFTFDSNTPRKIAMIRQKEVAFSRLSKQDKTKKRIEWHGYSGGWAEGKQDEDLIVTPFLDRDAPLFDLKNRTGRLPGEDGKARKDDKEPRYMMSLALPMPGRYYYAKSYWWSIFESGWYDFSCAIPKLKKALIENQMVLRYHVQINENFWAKLFKSEGISESDPKKVKERKTEFYTQIDKFLAGEDNAGKNFASHFKYDQIKGFEVHDIIIKPLEQFIKGGEYIEDSEEATNMISNPMGVHPSTIGASPGKGNNLNGSSQRELFTIKQAMQSSIREQMLSVLEIVKVINGWDRNIEFVIPNIMLTTLDKNTGAEKVIGNNSIE